MIKFCVLVAVELFWKSCNVWLLCLSMAQVSHLVLILFYLSVHFSGSNFQPLNISKSLSWLNSCESIVVHICIYVCTL